MELIHSKSLEIIRNYDNNLLLPKRYSIYKICDKWVTNGACLLH